MTSGFSAWRRWELHSSGLLPLHAMAKKNQMNDFRLQRVKEVRAAFFWALTTTRYGKKKKSDEWLQASAREGGESCTLLRSYQYTLRNVTVEAHISGRFSALEIRSGPVHSLTIIMTDESFLPRPEVGEKKTFWPVMGFLLGQISQPIDRWVIGT